MNIQNLFLLFIGYPLFATAMPAEITVQANTSGRLEFPTNFRTMLPKTENENSFSIQGLDRLNASGSGQYSELGLENIIAKIPAMRETVLVIDLRQEPHAFVDGVAMHLRGKDEWAFREMSDDTVAQIEEEWIAAVERFPFVEIQGNIQPVERIESERQLVLRFGLNYQRYYVTDHMHPNDKTVDHFIELIRSLPENTWLHIHCGGGLGRATTFLAMYDMIHNSHNVSCEDILMRQQRLGGQDLNKEGEGYYKKESSIARKAFLQQFYRYCVENPNLEKSWGKWVVSLNDK